MTDVVYDVQLEDGSTGEIAIEREIVDALSYEENLLLIQRTIEQASGVKFLSAKRRYD